MTGDTPSPALEAGQRVSPRERARQVLRRIHESNVRLSFGPGMHVMTPDKFVFDAVLEALEEASLAPAPAAAPVAARTADGSMAISEVIDGVMDLFPGADRQALQCLAELLTKPATPPASLAEPVGIEKRLRDLKAEYDPYDHALPLGRVHGTATIGEFVTIVRIALGTLLHGDDPPAPTSPTVTTATDEEVAKMVEILGWHREHPVTGKLVLTNPDGPAAADLLARVAAERDEARLVARYETDVAAAEIEGRNAAEAALEKAREALRDLRSYAASVWFDEADASDEERQIMDHARAALAAMEAGDGK